MSEKSMSEYRGEPMNGVDTAWLRMDRPENLMVVTAMVIVDRLSFSAFRDLVQQRFLAFERFRRKPVSRSGFYFWEPEERINLDAHICRTVLPEECQATDADKKQALQCFVSGLISAPLNPERPLWQFHFIENYGDRCAIVMRIHHCYADGLSLVAVLGALTDDRAVAPVRRLYADQEAAPEAADGESSSESEIEPWQAYQKVMDAALRSLEKYSRLGLRMSEGGLHLLREPASLKSLGRLALNALGEMSRLTSLPSDPETAVRGALGVQKTCLWTDPLPLDRVKAIGRQYGCSLNDVLVSCVTGALRRYLAASQALVPDFEIRATVPVNVRPVADADNGRCGLEPGNQFGTLFMSLPLGIANPVERIYRIKHEMQKLRRSMQPGISYGLMAALGLVPGRIQQQVIELFSRKSSLVLSNVPGIQQLRYLAGSRIHEALFWVPQSGDIALGISLLSYNDQVQVGLVADQAVIAAPQKLLDAFARELAAHEAGFRPAAGESAGRAGLAGDSAVL